MTTTNNFGVTLLESSQAQKEITINEAFGIIDAALKGSVLDKDLATPPGSPGAGDAYIVAGSPTGAWSGKAKSIAYYDTLWRFIAPVTGMRVWVSDEASYYAYNGTAWVASNPAGGGGGGGGGPVDASTLTGTTLAAGVVNSSLTSVGTIATGTWNATAISAGKGGTGQTSYTLGDMLYASGSSALSKLAGVATGNALISGGVGSAPSYGKIGLATHVDGTLPVANGGTGDTGTAWTNYTPTITPASGTFTSASATGRYKQIGKTVFIQVAVSITTNGTAAGNVRVTLPATVAAFHHVLSGRENNVTGYALNAVVAASTNYMYITKYDNTYPGANGYALCVTGVYEAA